MSLLKTLIVHGLLLMHLSEQSEDLEMKMVHVLFRHGARTPATNIYPTDPHINYTYEPYGLGHMTTAGKQQMFEVGDFLRKRYDSFLGRELNIDEIHAQSSGISRAKVSLQLALAGLFPPKGTAMEWNENLNWQPIPFDYEGVFQDMLLMVNVPCPTYTKEYEQIVKTETEKYNRKYKNIYDELSNHTGLEPFGISEFTSVFDTLKSQKELGLKLPEWTQSYFPDKMQEFYNKFFVLQVFNEKLKRLKGGPFLKKIIGDWEKMVQRKTKKKFHIYSGHDISIVNLLAAMNAWEIQSPHYGMTVMLELWQSKKTMQYGVKIFLRKPPLEPIQLKIEGCVELCPLEKLKRLLNDHIPVDWDKECME